MIDRLRSTPLGQYITARHSLWRMLHQVHPHPVSRHIQTQLERQRDLPILLFVVFWGIVVFIGSVGVYSRFGIDMIPLIPLLLVIWSSAYTLPWLYQVTAVVKRQQRNDMLEMMAVIPQGRTFVTYAICHAVMSIEDRLSWIGIIRRLLTLMVSVSFLPVLCIAVTLIRDIAMIEVFGLIFDIIWLAGLLYLEHQQSTLLVCYLVNIAPQSQERRTTDLTTFLLPSYLLIQMVTWAISILLIIVVDVVGIQHLLVSSNVIPFLLVREGVLWGLSYMVRD